MDSEFDACLRVSFGRLEMLGPGSGSEIVSDGACCARCADCGTDIDWRDPPRQDFDLLSEQGGEDGLLRI